MSNGLSSLASSRFFRGVPDISAEAAGAFRIGFALALLGLVALLDFGDARIKAATLAALLLFAIGLWTRPASVVAVAGLTFYAIATRRGHDWSMPLLTFWCLLPARWADAWSVDAALRQWRQVPSRELRGRAYGFAIWLPGLTLGSALAAAAVAKLSRSGFEWVTTGAVRYHFVEDSADAPVDWGLWIASHDTIPVLLSAGALAAEAAFILVIFFAGARARAMFGVVGLLLFGGFYLFQGVLWLPWWIVLTAFLPWGLIGRGQALERPVSRPLRFAHAFVVLVVLVQQAIASAWHIEIEPFISPYPMYSNTYRSPADFNDREQGAFRYQRYYFEIDTPRGTLDVTDRIRALDDAERALHQVIADSKGCPRRLEGDVNRRMTAVRTAYRARYGTPLDAVRVIHDRRIFDWERGEFYWAVRRERQGVVDLSPPTFIPASAAAAHCTSAADASGSY